ncbi:MAG: insulinase family protein [Desulfovibrio sp.]|jgi:Zn-dependent M16 (insulinase) family peptidase|nr:insulinase family protein [Desulfovibrio sp.]
MQSHGFDLVFERTVHELNSRIRLWRHGATGAQLLSCCNADENKVFGVTFRTPPSDSTGVAHILEHSVLCGSEKYPVKEPFVELLKGSLQTFLNAFTYPDKTCYPVASANLQDFRNLVDVYLDAVFFPRITEEIFRQEGWHIEADAPEGPFAYKGVVYNEMKGVYSSPESILSEQSQQALFPDITYGLDSGGNPEHIPDLTYEQFANFHATYYHPGNARFFFWGDDPEEDRLACLAAVLARFQRIEVDSAVPLQPRSDTPRMLEVPYAASEGDDRGMVTMNWLLCETADVERNFAFEMLEHILLGLPGSPLRRALIESGLGEDVAGVGLESDLRQMYFSVGLKGIEPRTASDVEMLIMETLADLAEEGLPADAVEAAVNSVEFALRENNSGRYPVGLAVMVRSLTTWLYDKDPLALLEWEKPLASIKARIASGERYFEGLIREWLLDNQHVATVLLTPDRTLADRREAAEAAGLEAYRQGLRQCERVAQVEETRALRSLQEAPDSLDALATIPGLKLEDLPKENRPIPSEDAQAGAVPVLFHDLDTSGIAYTETTFDLSAVPARLVPLVPLFGRALFEMGTAKRDFVDLGMRIARKTGGMDADTLFATTLGARQPVARLVVHAKATRDNVPALYDLLSEVLLEAKFDDRERFQRMVLEEKARQEHVLVPSGHGIVMARLRAGYNAAGWLDEATSGVSYLAFLRTLAERLEKDWDGVLADLAALRALVVRRSGCLMNLTANAEGASMVSGPAATLAAALPDAPAASAVAGWHFHGTPAEAEALVMPAQVNYVGKAADLYGLGYTYHGSANVVFKHLRMAFLWDRVRVQGGAYGAFCAFDRASGLLTQVSYRDPNVAATLDVYDATADYLRRVSLSSTELANAIVGAIGDVDKHMLPDAKGSAALYRSLVGDSDAARQQMRDEILSTTNDHFRALAEVMAEAARTGRVAVLGGAALERVAADRGWIVERVL